MLPIFQMAGAVGHIVAAARRRREAIDQANSFSGLLLKSIGAGGGLLYFLTPLVLEFFRFADFS